MIEGLANLDAVCSATASRTEGGWRALDLRVWEGIDARLLPDRGLDCFGAWYRGVPLAWVSAVGERGPLGGRLRDDDWLRGFGGGLVATCGLRNVGVGLACDRDEIDGCGIGVWLSDGSLFGARHCDELADQPIQMFCRSLDLGDGLDISGKCPASRCSSARWTRSEARGVFI